MQIVDRDGTPEEARKLGLLDGEFEMIVGHLGRTPSFTELAMFSGMWSEHCSYKNSILILKTLYSESDRMLAKPGEENAGALRINDKQAVVFKVESHNHPSAVEPYQGAATGVGGIMRDIFTMGARPVATLNSLRFGHVQLATPRYDSYRSSPDESLGDRALNQQQNKYLFTRVVKGIGDYGNSLGIPNAGGEIFFHESYNRNPLVNAMTVGVADIDKMASAKIPKVAGNYVVYVGAKTGRDGIHGASFASKNLSKESEEERSAVQVGDPFLEKLVMEATLECIQKKLVLAIQDMGAAGLVSSSSEMAASGGVGVRLDLEKVPARETQMQPFEFMLSESQERMLMVVDPVRWNEVKAVFTKWELDAAIIGETMDGNQLQIFMNGECYANLPADVLSKKAPRYVRETKAVPMKTGGTELTQLDDLSKASDVSGVTKLFCRLLGHTNLCSRRPIYRQFDTDIGRGRVIGPGQNGCVVRVPNSNEALAMTIDGNGFYIQVNPYNGAQHTVAEAVRNIAATGAIPLGLTNCLNFANPYIPENFWYFKEAVTGMSDACRAFKLPIISGNVSFYNESEDGPVLPTSTMGVVGLIENAEHALPAAPVDTFTKLELYLCGKFMPSQNASQYQYIEGKAAVGPLPELDLNAEITGAQKMVHLAKSKILRGAIDLSSGGLLRALCRMAFATYEAQGKMPSLTLMPQVQGDLSLDTWLLGETAHTYLVAVDSNNAPALIKEATPEFPVVKVGELTVGGEKLRIAGMEIPLNTLYTAWSKGLSPYLG